MGSNHLGLGIKKVTWADCSFTDAIIVNQVAGENVELTIVNIAKQSTGLGKMLEMSDIVMSAPSTTLKAEWYLSGQKP